jgi:lipoate-protein ligase B
LPVTNYNKALALQHRLVASRKKKLLNSDLVLLLEHPAVFTLGRRGGLSNLIVSPDYLKKKGIAIVPAERGGDITFHDIGQLIAYPIVNLRANQLSVTDYVSALEEVMIGAAAKLGVTAVRRDLNRGVWVGARKLGSIGIAIRHGITFHGMAFNVNLSLTPFDWIRPCGLHNVRVTSLARERSQPVNMEDVREILIKQFEFVFNIHFQVMTLESLP